MKARGVVYKRGKTWFYRVGDSQGKLVLCDNTNNFHRMLDACLRDVAAIRRIEGAGHRLQYSYGQLVDKAAGL